LELRVDGYSHQLEDIQEKDTVKENRMKSLGIHVMRFTDNEVMIEMENVLREIEAFVDQKMQNGHTPNPSQE